MSVGVLDPAYVAERRELFAARLADLMTCALPGEEWFVMNVAKAYRAVTGRQVSCEHIAAVMATWAGWHDYQLETDDPTFVAMYEVGALARVIHDSNLDDWMAA